MSSLQLSAAGLDSSLRHHPELEELFRQNEGTPWPEQALSNYAAVVPDHADRAEAAKQIFKLQDKVVATTVDYIFSVYPFEKIDYSNDKCPRDVGMVATYATHAMLCNDPAWLRDKFLLWLRTILQAFQFPTRYEGSPILFAKDAEKIASLPDHVQCLFETYTTLQSQFRQELTPQSYFLFAPFMQQSIDTITAP